MSDELFLNDEDAAVPGGSLKDHATSRSARLIAGAERFSGPIPPPDVLRAYQQINPEFAERIFHMAEPAIVAYPPAIHLRASGVLLRRGTPAARAELPIAVQHPFSAVGVHAGRPAPTA